MRKNLRMAGTLAAAAAVVLMVGGFTSRPAVGGTAAQPAAAAAAKIRPGGLLVRTTPKAGSSAAREAAGIANAIESTNWAGYVSHQANVSFQKVEATFFVPYLNCTVSPGRYHAHGVLGLGRHRRLHQRHRRAGRYRGRLQRGHAQLFGLVRGVPGGRGDEQHHGQPR